MPRIVEVTIPPHQTSKFTERVAKLDQVISMRIEKGISVQPPGDVVTIGITDRSLPRLMQLLNEMGVNDSPDASIITSRPDSIISNPSATSITEDSSESTWEELESMLNKESIMTLNSIATMGLAGIIAAAGILTNTLHVVVGAMVIAPGFEPISRIALGLVSGSLAWQRGLSDTLKGYLALIIGAALATLIIMQLGYSPSNTKSSYLSDGMLLDYWSSISTVSVLVSLAAGIAGAILVITLRSVLTAGVMIALALIPAASLIGIGLASGSMSLAGKGLIRLTIDIGLVIAMSLIVFAWKRYRVEKRKMSL